MRRLWPPDSVTSNGRGLHSPDYFPTPTIVPIKMQAPQSESSGSGAAGWLKDDFERKSDPGASWGKTRVSIPEKMLGAFAARIQRARCFGLAPELHLGFATQQRLRMKTANSPGQGSLLVRFPDTFEPPAAIHLSRATRRTRQLPPTRNPDSRPAWTKRKTVV